jgi:hypothetical protein
MIIGVGVGRFSLLIKAIGHIEFTTAQFSHSIIPGQAVKQITSTSCLHFLE